MPAIDERSFEPEVIAPTGFFGKNLEYIPIVAVIIGWFNRSVVRPTYVRIAPGIIQVLEYGFAGSKPKIRSYPMVHGTIAFVCGPTVSRKPMVNSLTMMRGADKDVLPLDRIGDRDRDRVIERIWHALLSTAPTPPLSDEELLG